MNSIPISRRQSGETTIYSEAQPAESIKRKVAKVAGAAVGAIGGIMLGSETIVRSPRAFQAAPRVLQECISALAPTGETYGAPNRSLGRL
jgi:hypothetical protein